MKTFWCFIETKGGEYQLVQRRFKKAHGGEGFECPFMIYRMQPDSYPDHAYLPNDKVSHNKIKEEGWVIKGTEGWSLDADYIIYDTAEEAKIDRLRRLAKT